MKRWSFEKRASSCLMNEGAYAWINLPLTPALLRLDPMFDPLRKEPRFQKLGASYAQLL
jgi:hypothetical protein